MALYKQLFLYIMLGMSILLVSCDSKIEEQFMLDDRGIYSADISQNNKYVVVASVDKSAKLYDINTGQHIHTWTFNKGLPTEFNHTKISDDGKIAVTASAKNIGIWDTNTGKSLGYYAMPGVITDIALSKYGTIALIGLNNKSAILLDLTSGKLVGAINTNSSIKSVSLAKDYSYALLGLDNGIAELHDLKKNKVKFKFSQKPRISYVSISPNNKYALVAASYKPVKIFDINSGKLVQSLPKSNILTKLLSKPIVNVTSAMFTNDDSKIIIGSPPRHVRTFEVNTGNLLSTYVIPKHKMFKPTSALVFAIGLDENKNKLFIQGSNGFSYITKDN